MTRVHVLHVVNEGYQPALAVTQTLRLIAGPAGLAVRPGPRGIS